MNSISLRSLTRRALFVGVWLALTFALAFGAGLRFNPTPSLPKGIYRLVPGLPEKNDLVSFCLEGEFAKLALECGYLEPGSCPPACGLCSNGWLHCRAIPLIRPHPRSAQ